VTESAPTSDSRLANDVQSWLDEVERSTRRRARVEMLITAKGLLKPVTLAQRFVIKSREVGIGGAVGIVAQRLRARASRGAK
jgi:hypothetical protein